MKTLFQPSSLATASVGLTTAIIAEHHCIVAIFFFMVGVFGILILSLLDNE